MSLFSKNPTVEILAVCTANICRSPMAEGLLREELKLLDLGKKVRVVSAGTHVTRPGQCADARAVRVCAREGIDLRKARTRRFVEEDFRRFAYILAMDEKNLEWLLSRSPVDYRGRISLMGSWAVGGDIGDIPDPYFGSQSGFEEVLCKLHQCVEGFLAEFVGRENIVPG